MVPRIWVCTEQPALLEVLAFPLHVVSLLGILVLWCAATLFGLRRLAEVLQSFLLVLSGVALSLVVLVELVGLLQDVLVRNPSPFLALAPWIGAVGGPSALLMAAVRVRRRWPAMGNLAQRTAWPKPLVLYAGVVALAGIVIVLGRDAAYRPDVAGGLLSLPYRWFEYALVVRLGPATDECLASRILEYGETDDIAQDAREALTNRGRSATPGVKARLNELRRAWPPPDYSTTRFGIAWLLRFLEKRGEKATVVEWEESNWEMEFQRVQPHADHLIWQ